MLMSKLKILCFNSERIAQNIDKLEEMAIAFIGPFILDIWKKELLKAIIYLF